MTDPALVPEHSVATGMEEDLAPPRADLADAIGWIVFGIAVLIGSLTMDRLEQQNINPVTIPGLLPGLLGIAMILLGGVLGVRSLRRGALAQPLPPATPITSARIQALASSRRSTGSRLKRRKIRMEPVT